MDNDMGRDMDEDTDKDTDDDTDEDTGKDPDEDPDKDTDKDRDKGAGIDADGTRGPTRANIQIGGSIFAGAESFCLERPLGTVGRPIPMVRRTPSDQIRCDSVDLSGLGNEPSDRSSDV
jgi:hypothetical protein